MSSMREPPILRNHLPHDLVLNILANLPVKSVLRFRCVRKSWNSSITGPSFISSHLELNSSRRLLFMKPDRFPHIDRQLCTVICEHTSDRISEFDIPFTWPKLVGSCNGLLCFSARDWVYFLNPSIGKFKAVSPAPSSSSASFYLAETGFCYHSETNYYKIVTISYYLAGTPPQAEIYSINSGSWKRLHPPFAPDILLFNIHTDLFLAPFVSGALHWMAYVREGGNARPFILTFDVNVEKFGMMETPFAVIRSNLCPRVFKGKLALTEKGDPLFFNVWVMKEYGIHQSWTKLFVVPFHRVERFNGYSDNGLLIVEKSYDIFSANGEVERTDLKRISIDIETLHEKDVGGIQDFLRSGTNFMESLVLLDRTDMVTVRL
nr:F-box protein CPR1-like [Quercus suber]